MRYLGGLNLVCEFYSLATTYGPYIVTNMFFCIGIIKTQQSYIADLSEKLKQINQKNPVEIEVAPKPPETKEIACQTMKEGKFDNFALQTIFDNSDYLIVNAKTEDEIDILEISSKFFSNLDATLRLNDSINQMILDNS